MEVAPGYFSHALERKTCGSHGEFATPYLALLYCLKAKFYMVVLFPYPSGGGSWPGTRRVTGYCDGHRFAHALRTVRQRAAPRKVKRLRVPRRALRAADERASRGQRPSFARFRVKVSRLGLGCGLACEIATTDPAYHRWTQ